uniref:Adenosine 5'-monophosphoramidase HINT3 n=1 Tax=Geotrypetes seraphini TaxID=260995 RepID=A0A6P8Q648_GEOSA|nr:histidine triad nucleotide-binding protein 3 isoform X4 [Geotrypetes seraphini]
MAGEASSGAEKSWEGQSEFSSCIFCRIANNEEKNTELLPCENEDLVCFKDIKPAAPHHYLVVPKKHVGNCKTLTKDHVPLVQTMMDVGRTILEHNNVTDAEEIRYHHFHELQRKKLRRKTVDGEAPLGLLCSILETVSGEGHNKT